MSIPRQPAAIALMILMSAAAAPWAEPDPQARGRLPPPAFADPDRVARLERAFPEIDRLFKAFAERERVPGIAYGIVIDGRLAHAGAAGVRDVRTKDPVDLDTVFRIASMTKSFTALCIMRLRDEGKLGLDDPADRYVPELAGLAPPTADSPRVTIRHLLSHAAGFPEDNPWGDRQLAATDDGMARMLERGIPFSTATGTAYEYSNYGFAILGRVVSRAAGMPYEVYVADAILKPLGMTATTLEAASVPPSRLARGYRLEEGGWVDEPLLPHGAFGAMGGMLTSARDLAAYVAFLSSAWPPRDDPDIGPVRRASLREMQQVWRPSPSAARRSSVDGPLQLSAGGYGFGLRVWQSCGFGHLVAHSGGLPGFGSHMRWLPEYGVALFAMGNLTYTNWGLAADDAIEALARTGGLQPRVAQPSAALLDARARVIRLIDRWDEREAAAVAADNLFLDEPADRRRAQLESIRAAQGACRANLGFNVENALRGTWTETCDRGWLRVGITLAPTEPPLVQEWVVVPVRPLAPGLDAAAAAIARAVSAQRRGPLSIKLGAGVAPEEARRLLDSAAAWGACRVGELLASDGERAATIRLACAKGDLDLSLALDPATRVLTRLALAPAAGGTCVP
ncbi:MAG TPA: serine hydrolase domain-containing protein [Vicinamibacterales bacterium]|nr:serine hydrolase domain-containing protein [Vicinamibacterales bacterium]HPW19280.1 serine hydrolase domain-containing protein [Vicinamibacterales bacterium]